MTSPLELAADVLAVAIAVRLLLSPCGQHCAAEPTSAGSPAAVTPRW